MKTKEEINIKIAKLVDKWHPAIEYTESSRIELNNEIFQLATDFADLKTDAALEVYRKPLEVLKPLEDLWRAENPRDTFTLPDTTEFLKWILGKVNQDKWISVETPPEKKEERYQCLVEVHPIRQSFYESQYAIVQDWVIRQHPHNFKFWKVLTPPTK